MSSKPVMKVDLLIGWKGVAIGIIIAIVAGIAAGVTSPYVSHWLNQPRLLILCTGSPVDTLNSTINITQIDIINQGNGPSDYFVMTIYARSRITSWRFTSEPVLFRVLNTTKPLGASLQIESEGEIWPHSHTIIEINESGKAGLSYINITTDSVHSVVNATSSAYQPPFYKGPALIGCE